MTQNTNILKSYPWNGSCNVNPNGIQDTEWSDRLDSVLQKGFVIGTAHEMLCVQENKRFRAYFYFFTSSF